MASLTHRYIPRHRYKYIPQTKQTEENLFIEEYYSSTDTKIYIDGIEQTEISYINYSLSEQLKPIFGYNSNTFDDVAIGSRIVTGVFKTPICNSDKQSTAEDIEARGLSVAYGDTMSGFDEYNKNEEETVSNTEWIGDTNKTPGESESPNQYEDDKTYEYRKKLELLGYLPEGSFGEESLIDAIKKFQDDNGKQATGDLDSITMEKIDNKIINENPKKSLGIPRGTMVYFSPLYSMPLYPTGIIDDTKGYVLDVLENDEGTPEWLLVSIINGEEGYVNINDNPSFREYLLSQQT